jgi:hypothetical protein
MMVPTHKVSQVFVTLLLFVATTMGMDSVATSALAAPGPHVVAAFPNTIGLSQAGGYVLYNNGKVNALNGAPFYGDARKSGITNFAALNQAYGGYWLVTATGKVYSYGSVCQGDKISPPKNVVSPIVGTLSMSQAQMNNSNIDTGFQMVNAKGTVYSYLCLYSF